MTKDSDTALTFGSLFAGVGGFDLGMEAAGWRCGFQVEWDARCQSVLARHWPDVPRWGDVSDVSGTELPPVDCITFGSPCQDLSLAGHRAGLQGERSGFFHEAIRIIKEMRHATVTEPTGPFPRIVVWENVVGALSSNGGADFGAVLNTLADTGALVIEWAVLDARWFGVPQRRRRVFVVAVLNPVIANCCPDPLLPVAPRNHWNPPTRNETKLDNPTTHSSSTVTFCLQPNDRRGEAPGALRAVLTDLAPTIAATDGVKTTDRGLRIGCACHGTRRATPLESERLMGWPDDHTRWTADGTEQADSDRYRQIGNGVAAPVAAWIGKHLANLCRTPV